MRMTAESPIFTLRQVAKLLGEDQETLFEIACDMTPREGCVTVHDEAYTLDEMRFIGTAFTHLGIEHLATQLAKRSTPH